MNFHSDEWIMEQIQRHYDEALTLFPADRIVGVFCQGSTNYGLDTEFSDIDTKLVLLPSFEDLCMARQPVSTTHVLPNDEHLDTKDFRLYANCFRKQNINFLEILFTKYKIVNPMYEEQWNRLVAHREEIAHYNIYQAMKAMDGMVKEKYHALEHPYPAKAEIIKTWGYDGKQLSHMIRVYDFMRRYMQGVSYEICLIAQNPEILNAIKLQGHYTLDEARKVADICLELTAELFNKYPELNKNGKYNVCNPAVDELLNDVQYQIMLIAMRKELENK